MTERDRCGATKNNGGTCPNPIGLCPACGHCKAHCAYNPECKYTEEEVQEARQRGGRTQKRQASEGEPSGLDPDELPPLEDHDAAKLWLEVIGRAVATNRLGPREAQAAIRSVHTWLNAEAEQVTREEMKELRSAVERLQAEVGDGKLEVLT